MSAYVLLDMGDISHTYPLLGLLQWTYRYVHHTGAYRKLSLMHSLEGLIIACSMMIASGIWGPQIWTTPITTAFPFLSQQLGAQTTIRDLWVPIIMGTFLVAHLPACVYNVWLARKARGQPLAPLFLEWTPMVIFTGCVMAWLGSPHSFLLKENHLALFCFTMSLVFGRMTTKIILAHLTHQPFPYWTIMLAPLIGGAFLANLPTFGFESISHEKELLYLRCYFGFAVIVYGTWAYTVISSICEYLGINCLTIPQAGRQRAVSKVANGELKLPKEGLGNGVEKHD
jgi:ethanolaminephosphotransferase